MPATARPSSWISVSRVFTSLLIVSFSTAYATPGIAGTLDGSSQVETGDEISTNEHLTGLELGEVDCNIDSNVIGDGSILNTFGTGSLTLNADVSNFNSYNLHGSGTVSCMGGCFK